jgi:hypothetical protein
MALDSNTITIIENICLGTSDNIQLEEERKRSQKYTDSGQEWHDLP